MIDFNCCYLFVGVVVIGVVIVIGFGLIIVCVVVLQVGMQVFGFYCYKVGVFECILINDGVWIFLMLDKFVVNKLKEEVFVVGEVVYMLKGMVIVLFNL